MHHDHFQTHLRKKNYLQVNGKQAYVTYYRDKKTIFLALQRLYPEKIPYPEILWEIAVHLQIGHKGNWQSKKRQ